MSEARSVYRAMAVYRRARLYRSLFDLFFLLLIAIALGWPASKALSYYNAMQAKAAAYDEIQAYLIEQTKVAE